ncbi:hypothetical protein HCU40_24175 [Pseudanabaena biceps]|nr:hypothetical protein [Pseudanabaena biceps]
MGFLLTEQKNYTEAAKIYRQAIAVAPTDCQNPSKFWAIVLRLAGKTKKPLRYIVKPDKIRSFNADVLVAVGDLFAKKINSKKRSLNINALSKSILAMCKPI